MIGTGILIMAITVLCTMFTCTVIARSYSGSARLLIICVGVFFIAVFCALLLNIPRCSQPDDQINPITEEDQVGFFAL